jgi:16S rRNA (guanine966-N2)-methyltransferase
MRIIAGRWRGRKLVSPPGLATRPTADRAREALFSMLASRLGSFEGLAVADLFAGSGALGLEALSRGAAHCTFVEKDPKALAAIRANLGTLGAKAEVVPGGAEQVRLRGPFDLAFVDPPYGSGLAIPALLNLPLVPGAVASVETERGETVSAAGFAVEAVRRFGKAKLTLLRVASQA